MSSILLGFVAGVLVAMLFGAINGTIIAKLGVPSFIVTLGMSFVARGVALIISGGNVVSGLPDGMRNFGMNRSCMSSQARVAASPSSRSRT